MFAGFNGQYNDVEWVWYHIGSSERFSKPNIRPENYTSCIWDENWMRKTEEILDNYERIGFKFTGIKNFVDDISKTDFIPNPSNKLLDGAWNMKSSSGGFIWMGENGKEHEDVLSVRNHNWLSR